MNEERCIEEYLLISLFRVPRASRDSRRRGAHQGACLGMQPRGQEGTATRRCCDRLVEVCVWGKARLPKWEKTRWRRRSRNSRATFAP